MKRFNKVLLALMVFISLAIPCISIAATPVTIKDATSTETTSTVAVIDNKLLVTDTGFLHEVMSGNVTGHSYVSLQGHSHSVGTTEQELSALGSADFGLWPPSPAGVILVSTDVDDDGDPVDTGARTVTIYGLDEVAGEWVYAETTVTMNGTTPTTVTAQTFIRINRMEVTAAGTSLTNEGDITATISGSGISKIYAEHTTAKDGRLTIASDEEGHFQNLEGSSISGKEMTFHIYCRDNTIANDPFHLRGSWHSKDGGFRPNGFQPIFTEKTDILIQVHSELAGATASGSIEGYTKTIP